VQVPLNLLLDPQDRRTSNPPAQALLEPKQEEGTSKDATFGLVNDLSNRIVKVEKMLQNQLVISPPKPINQRRPYQYAKKNDEPKPQHKHLQQITLIMLYIVELVAFPTVRHLALSLPKLYTFMSKERTHLVTKTTL
jgi:hypothetical protein